MATGALMNGLKKYFWTMDLYTEKIFKKYISLYVFEYRKNNHVLFIVETPISKANNLKVTIGAAELVS